ncbi:DUF5345 family protein [Cohnella sp. GCM10027633]|uniref:DUF5345 family protein n=1 Tax=unclassified Cohnella TaxID=2636738 RepID=UPI00362A49A0
MTDRVPRFDKKSRVVQDDESELFEELLGSSLRDWDGRTDPAVPHLIELESLVAEHKKSTERNLWMDLLKLWGVGLFALASLFLLLRWNTAVFAIVQGAVAIGAIAFLAASSRIRRREAKE